MKQIANHISHKYACPFFQSLKGIYINIYMFALYAHTQMNSQFPLLGNTLFLSLKYQMLNFCTVQISNEVFTHVDVRPV